MDSATKKKLKKDFKETKFGKRAFISYIICLIVFFITLILYYVLMNTIDEDYYDTVRWLCVIVVAITFYFEGAYAGALKQYMIDHMKK
jgi:hypothetical protein